MSLLSFHELCDLVTTGVISPVVPDDINGNVFSWVFDDIQGTRDGLTTVIQADSTSLTTAPYPSCKKGMGWRPDGKRDWSGDALIRGGCWVSESYAGAFYLGDGFPDVRYGGVGFRCTLPGEAIRIARDALQESAPCAE